LIFLRILAIFWPEWDWRNRMRRVALSEIKDHLSEYLKVSRKEDIVITRHGKPVGVLIGFESFER
jgi:prevent-host-death family protein